MAENISAAIAWQLADAVRSMTKGKTGPSTGTATFVGTDSTGRALVLLPGADQPTPVHGAISANAEVGSTVTYSLANGQLSITGNASDPAVGEAKATEIADTATRPIATAQRAIGAMADAAKRVAEDASAVASATRQHFWTDDSGVHVTDDEGSAWQEEYAKAGHGSLENPTDQRPWHNVLVNSLGILLRRGLRNLVSITHGAVAFYDGAGNEASNVTASFGATGAQIGKDNARHAVVDSDGLTVYNADGTIAPVNATVDGANIVDASIVGGKIQGATLTDIPYAAISDADIEVARVADAEISSATITQAQVKDLSVDYARANLANVNNAWIENGTIRDAAIGDAQIIGVSANKLTAGTIDAAEINVMNLRADNLKVSRVNGQPVIGGYALVDPSSSGYAGKNPKAQGWYELTSSGYALTNDTSVVSGKAYYTTSTSVELYDQTYIDGLADDLNDRIDGAIETFTGTVVPTLNNTPASAWTTTKLRDEHVGDVYYVVNSQSQQNGYCYRFTKSGSTYSWQLIKDSDVTAALSRLQTAEGKITTFDSDISTLKTDTGELKKKTQSLETSLGDKVDVTTFNELSSDVEENSASITTLSNTVSQKADSSTVTTLSNTVNTVKQTADTNKTSITNLTKTVSDNKTAIENRASTIEQNLSGITTRVGKTEDELDTVSNPNLSPFFSFALDNYYNASSNPDGYWDNSKASYGTSLSDGWAHLSNSNTSSSTTWFTIYEHSAWRHAHGDLKGSTKYTVMIEFRNVTKSGDVTCIGTTTHASSWPSMFVGNSDKGNVAVADGVQYHIGTTVTDPSSVTGSTCTTRTLIIVPAGASIDCDIRISLYEGKYSGPYKPYVDQTLSSRVKLAETSIEQNSEQIALRATKTEVQQVRPAYASSSTAAGTAAKVATIDPAVTGYALYKGASVAVTFSTANTAATPTLNLNSTGAKQIRSYTGAALSEAEYKWAAGATIDLVYDGTYWRMQDSGSVKRVTAAEASIRVNADNIESKVSKDGVISSINQSAETVKIQASKVEIDGTAIFTAISSDVDDAITDKGYQTASQVNSAITSKGYATTTQAQGYATTAKSEAISAAATDATSKANAAQTAATNAANTATDNKLKSYSTTAQANNLYDAKGAAATVQDNLDNLEVGGRNLLPNSKDWSGAAKRTNGTIVVTSDTYGGCSVLTHVWGSGNSDVGYQGNVWTQPIEADAWYTLSFWAKASSAIEGMSYFFSSNVVDKGINSSGKTTTSDDGTIKNTITTEWQRIWVSWHIKADATSFPQQLIVARLQSQHSGVTLYLAGPKLEKGNKATDWTPAPDDIDASIETASGNGFYVKWDDNQGTTAAGGEARFYAYDPVTKTKGTGKGWVLWNGVKRTVPSAILNPNTAYPYNIPIYFVLRLSSATSTTGTIYAVWYNGGWKSAYPNAAISSTISDWTWAETTDIVLASCVEPASEAQFTDCHTYDPPLLCTQVTTITTTAASAQATANNAAPKANAVKRTQRIWYRKSASGAPSTPGTASSNWVTKADDGDDAWTKMHVAISSTHKYIYTCEQYEMANGTVGYTSVLLDNTITVIDGGNIITGSVTANKLNAADINASKSLTVGAMTDAAAATILNSNLNADISEAAKTAANYITHVDNNGITIHPSGLSSSKLQVNASGTTVYQNNEDVAFYGATSRIGKANGDRVEIDSTNGITIYKANSKRLQTSSDGVEVYGSLDQTNPVVSLSSPGGNSARMLFYKNWLRADFSSTSGLQVQTSKDIRLLAQAAELDLVLSGFNLIWLTTNTKVWLDGTDLEVDGDVDINSGAITIHGDAGRVCLQSTSENIGLYDVDTEDYIIRRNTTDGNIYLHGHNITNVDDHKFYAAPSGGGEAYFREIWASDIPNGMAASKITSSGPTNLTLNSASQAYSSGKTPKYRKWGNVVSVYGAVSPKTQVDAGGTLAIGTLPSGYRPPMDMEWLCQGSGNSVWLLSITTAGVLTASRYRNGASANAAMPTSAWLTFSVTFIVG